MGFYWSGVFGYRGSYLTAYDDGDYGVYAFGSQYGQFDHSYAGGHPDSGFYIGQCHPCHAVIADVLSENNGLGYSGTNAGGDLSIVNSEWRDNWSGIVPNTLDSEKLAPQRDALIAGNYVHDNDNVGAPAKDVVYPSLCVGILLAGGDRNRVVGNVVEDSSAYGILVSPNIDQNIWVAEGNVVRGNRVRHSGRADLGLAAVASKRNCFAGNDFRTSMPPAIQTFYGCGLRLNGAGGGDLGATWATLVRFLRSRSGDFAQGTGGGSRRRRRPACRTRCSPRPTRRSPRPRSRDASTSVRSTASEPVTTATT